MPRTRHRLARAFVLPALGLPLLFSACKGGQGGGGYAPPPPDVTVEEVAPQTVQLPYEYPGRVEGSRDVEVRARVSGILLRRAYDEGEPVRQGQLLFLIDPAPYRARVEAAAARVAEAKARAARAEREAKRLEPLLAEHATSQKAYDDAVSENEQAHAALLSTEADLTAAKLDLSYTRVEAPISGLSGRAEKSEGALAEPGDRGLLTHIVQVKPIWVRFSVADRDLRALEREAALDPLSRSARRALEVELELADGSTYPEHGRVNFSDPRVDRATGTVDLRAELPNTKGDLLPGQFVRVRLVGIVRPDAILVPQRAVQQGQQGRFVFVVGSDGKAEARPVEVGDWLGDRWIIENGLVAGDRVVVDGAVKVQPGAEVHVVEPGGNATTTGEPSSN